MAKAKTYTKRTPITPERLAEVLELDAKGGPDLVASTFGYKREYAVQLIRRAKGPTQPANQDYASRAEASKSTKIVRRYLEVVARG